MCSVARCRLCSSQCLYFMESDGKISVLVMLLHMLCLLSVWPYSASRFQALFGMQVSSVEKLNTKTSNCLLLTHPYLPLLPPHNHHLLRELAYGMRWDLWSRQRLQLVLPGGALKSELWCLSGVPQFQSQGIRCLKPSFSSPREFPSPFNVTKASKC